MLEDQETFKFGQPTQDGSNSSDIKANTSLMIMDWLLMFKEDSITRTETSSFIQRATNIPNIIVGILFMLIR